jgi:5-formyltetrahydrofolate cyclo-ligase
MVAFEAQKLAAIPVDPWDRPVEQVFTEDAVYQKQT